jgi:hypothetical protein
LSKVKSIDRLRLVAPCSETVLPYLRSASIVVIATIVGALAGCGQSLSLTSLGAPTVETSVASITAAAAALPLSGNTPTLDGTTSDIYSLIANSALKCWLGAGGPLKGTHIFHADVPAPSSAGVYGDVDIAIHERDPTQPSPRGTRVVRIALVAETSARTRMNLQFGKLPADLVQALEKDAIAWAHGKDSCEAQVVRPPPPPPAPIAAKPKKGKKVAAATSKRP